MSNVVTDWNAAALNWYSRNAQQTHCCALRIRKRKQCSQQRGGSKAAVELEAGKSTCPSELRLWATFVVIVFVFGPLVIIQVLVRSFAGQPSVRVDI